MLLDLTRQHRKWASESSKAIWLDDYIQRLILVRERAKGVLADLTIRRIHPAKLGIGATEDTPAGILSNLGWKEPDVAQRVDALYQRAIPALTSAYKLQPMKGSEKSLPFALQDPRSDRTGTLADSVSGSEGTGLENLSETSCSSETSDVESMPSSRTSDTGSETPLSVHLEEYLHIESLPEKSVPKSYMSPLLEGADPGTAWDALDAKMAARFLVFCFTLSKYKTFGRFAAGVGGRLCPEEAIRAGDAMVADAWNRATPDYKYSKATRRLRLVMPHGKVFGGLSHHGKFDGRHIQNFLKERYHSNFFLVTFRLESTDAGTESGRPVHCRPLRHQVGWTMERVGQDWLFDEHGQGRPYVVVTGNSINGSYNDYMRVAHASERHQVSDCAENKAHVESFLAHDPDRLALAFFGHHRHYTFDSSGKEDCKGPASVEADNKTVAGHMDRAFPGLADSWSASHEEAADVGTAGASLHMFAWQHCFAETKGRIARLVYDAKDTLPISAPLSRLGAMSA
ncbi:hypothetical protein LEL_08890 [Akanthomyces lecanii RCEF 1005]|uniref:Uncharacterized protein n=1 Tax=Akanthomyces lecanii RCEF 1005 TaxID=1081108 RepID=A0A168CQ52_CORDF|nr:hypothetical protein LEL_08890 [Akanthomyces lecanii RCEF 1005]